MSADCSAMATLDTKSHVQARMCTPWDGGPLIVGWLAEPRLESVDTALGADGWLQTAQAVAAERAPTADPQLRP